MKPCRRGHTGGRYKSGACIECMALRKGRKGRKVPPPKIAPVLRSIQGLSRVLREEQKLQREKARAERLALRLENQAKAKAEQAAELERWKQKEAIAAEKRAERALSKPWARVPAAPTLTISTAPQPPADGEIRADSTGQKWLYRHRMVDGQLRKERAPIDSIERKTAEAPKAAEPAKAKTRVEEMRERYLQHHANINPGEGGFTNPGGIVTFNIAHEGGPDPRSRRLRLLDF